jgi:hypothetical protein
MMNRQRPNTAVEERPMTKCGSSVVEVVYTPFKEACARKIVFRPSALASMPSESYLSDL